MTPSLLVCSSAEEEPIPQPARRMRGHVQSCWHSVARRAAVSYVIAVVAPQWSLFVGGAALRRVGRRRWKTQGSELLLESKGEDGSWPLDEGDETVGAPGRG